LRFSRFGRTALFGIVATCVLAACQFISGVANRVIDPDEATMSRPTPRAMRHITL